MSDANVIIEETFTEEPGSDKIRDHLLATIREMCEDHPVILGVLCLTKEGSVRTGWLSNYQLTAELAEELLTSLAFVLSRDSQRLAEEIVKLQQQGPERGH